MVQWLGRTESHLLDRLLRAHGEEARQKCADEMVKAIENEGLIGDAKESAAKAKFYDEVISLLDRVKSGEKIEYVAVEHSVETST